MSNRTVKLTLVALTMIAILPAAVSAQKSARIRVGATVVRSVLPEAQTAAKMLLENVAQDGTVLETISSTSVSSADGIAQLYTERLASDVAQDSNPVESSRVVVKSGSQDQIRLTIAFTAN